MSIKKIPMKMLHEKMLFRLKPHQVFLYCVFIVHVSTEMTL